jgi:hypothetical protein
VNVGDLDRHVERPNVTGANLGSAGILWDVEFEQLHTRCADSQHDDAEGRTGDSLQDGGILSLRPELHLDRGTEDPLIEGH